MKRCTNCNQNLPLSKFWKNKTTKDGYQVWCKVCWKSATDKRRNGPKRIIELRQRRNRHLIRTYGISIEDYEDKLIKQGGVCGICNRAKDGIKALAVDHDHESGKVRGILCENCNRGIGMFKHDQKLLNLAIAYLDNHWW